MIYYTKIAADGSDLPIDANGHLVVRIERDLIARPMIWAAHKSAKSMSWKDAKEWAESLTINGWSWRLPTVEEAFLLCDHARTQFPLVDPAYFPDCDGEWIWTGTEDLVPPAGYAWLVSLDDGYSFRNLQTTHYHVRAVRAGQL